MLLVVWGSAVFLWSSFGAWARHQQAQHEKSLAASQMAGVQRWLAQVMAPVERLAGDSRLAEGLQLPAGVQSLPVQRVLYEFAYKAGQPEVYAVDADRRTVGATAGASPLDPPVLERLADLAYAGEQVFLGMGQRNGQVLVGHVVANTGSARILVLVPLTLGQLAAAQPATGALPGQRTLGLVLPHTAGWAWWESGEAGFRLQSGMVEAARGNGLTATSAELGVTIPLPGWPELSLGLHGPHPLTGARVLPQALVALWALVMTGMILWYPLRKVRRKALVAAAPVVGPVSGALRPIGAITSKHWDRLAAAWVKATADAPLVDGPGHFEQGDFVPVHTRLANMIRQGKRFRAPAGLNGGGPAAASVGPAISAPAAEGPVAPPVGGPEAPALPAGDGEKPDRGKMKDIITACLREGRVALLYQPIYRAEDNVPVMHEVFARLVTEDGRMMTPGEFLPTAIEHHLTLELDLAVFRRVKYEHFRDGAMPLTPLALNISSTSLDGITYLQEMVSQGGTVLQKLAFEVRSQEMIRDPNAMKLLKDLQRHGGNLAVDYFGGGIAMLEASRAMGFNYVKLDCHRFTTSAEAKKELIVLCQHARKLALPVILEKVEDAAMETFVRRAGGGYLQGYGMGMPQPAMSVTPLAPRLEKMAGIAGIAG